ncbi:uncharacterized protein BJ171DRAFT_637919, partial [Polychytrium aggregatum]|uniref:uncharacterized protein n=1 Tax=Polychytrium aggregatum TaxID=110093 RepID=UPI0022FE30E7
APSNQIREPEQRQPRSPKLAQKSAQPTRYALRPRRSASCGRLPLCIRARSGQCGGPDCAHASSLGRYTLGVSECNAGPCCPRLECLSLAPSPCTSTTDNFVLEPAAGGGVDQQCGPTKCRSSIPGWRNVKSSNISFSKPQSRARLRSCNERQQPQQQQQPGIRVSELRPGTFDDLVGHHWLAAGCRCAGRGCHRLDFPPQHHEEKEGQGRAGCRANELQGSRHLRLPPLSLQESPGTGQSIQREISPGCTHQKTTAPPASLLSMCMCMRCPTLLSLSQPVII